MVLPPFQPRITEEEIVEKCPWATLGKPAWRKPNIITTLSLDPYEMEDTNLRLQAKYREIEKNEVLYEEYLCDDAEYLVVAFGTCARVSQKAIEICRAEGNKIDLFRPITLFPFPTVAISKHADKVKSMLTVEMSAGQMVEDVRLTVNGRVPVEFYGRMGGVVPSPDEVYEALKSKLVK